MLRKRAPKLPVTVKLLVNALHAFCVLNEAEPVVLSTGTPLSTEPVEGIATVPVNWFVSPNTTPDLTLVIAGKLPGQFCVYSVLCSAYVSVSKVHVVVDPDMSCRFCANTALRLLTFKNGPVAERKCVVDVNCTPGNTAEADIGPLILDVPAEVDDIALAPAAANTLPDILTLHGFTVKDNAFAVDKAYTLPVIVIVEVAVFVIAALLLLAKTLPFTSKFTTAGEEIVIPTPLEAASPVTSPTILIFLFVLTAIA